VDGAGGDPLAARDPREGVARHGIAAPRGQDVDRASGLPGRRFGWMFDIRRQAEIGTDAIAELVRWMAEDDPAVRRADNTEVPAGFTYLGQFIDHDITFDPISKLDRPGDPTTLVNFRTPRFDLDSVYGSGPLDQPFLYDWKRSRPPGKKLLLAHNSPDAAIAGVPLASEDLPRNHEGRALIGDPRNDENVILTQLHLLFIRFHNAVVDHLVREDKVDEDELFEKAQRIVRWHYQWIVVHEFLPMVVGREMADRVLARREHFTGWDEPFIPLEFSLAAYRFGHSMVRSDYVLQRRARRATPLFPDLAGFRWLPARHVIDWELFFDLPGAGGGAPQSSQLINTTIAGPLWRLPESGGALPQRTLQRGLDEGLPSGQKVAKAMGEPVLADDLRLDDKVSRSARDALVRETPLWFYILREAERATDGDGRALAGRHLGPVGGRIVAEVLVGLLEGDPTSYLSEKPTWQPEELDTGGKFEMADLVEIAQRPPG
jgi:hypothetical protein